MNEELEDCNTDLITSEKLNTFSVVEQFCDICGDLTPHHIDDEKEKQKKLSEHKVLERPISESECVYCRESEESNIDDLI